MAANVAVGTKTSGWDWNHSSQSGDYFAKVQNKVTDKFLAHKSNWRRLSGFPLGTANLCISVVTLVSLIGEQAIKGVGNLVGALIPGSKFSATKGAKQLFLLVPMNLILLALAPLGVISAVVIVPIATAVVPDWILNYRARTRDERMAARQQFLLTFY